MAAAGVLYCCWLLIKEKSALGWSQYRDVNSIPTNALTNNLAIAQRDMWLRGKNVCSWCNGSLDRSFMVDPLSYFSFQPVLHDWFNKGSGMYSPVCGMMHIKEPLLLRKSSPFGGSGFPLSLPEWSFTIHPTPYNRKIKCVEYVIK